MKIQRTLRSCVQLFACVLLAQVFLACDERKPTEPPPPEPEVLKDYPVWFAADIHPMVYRYWPVAKKIDSLPFPYDNRTGLTVSADGKRLYAATWDKVTVVDTDSLKLITRLPFGSKSPVAVSPDNDLLSIHGDSLYILRTSDFSVVFSYPYRTQYGVFSQNGKTFYCAAEGYIYKVDLTDINNPVPNKKLWPTGVIQVIPSPDESKLYLYRLLALGVYGFDVYDVALDSMLFSYVHRPGAAIVTMAPDGKRLYFGNPGTLHQFAIPSAAFNIFDVAQNILLDSVLTSKFPGDSLFFDGFFLPESMRITPDGRWLVMIDAAIHAQVLLYDISRGEFTDYQRARQWLYSPSVQSNY